MGNCLLDSGLHGHLPGFGVRTGYLAEFRLAVAHQEVDAILGCVFDVGQLFANSREDDVVGGHAVVQHQTDFSLRQHIIDTYVRTQDIQVPF